MGQGTLAKALLILTAASFGALAASITTTRAHAKGVHVMSRATVPQDHLLRVVGQGDSMMKLEASGQRIVASAGPVTYTAMPDGSLEPLEKASVYETFFGPSESLTGYVHPLPYARSTILGAHDDVVQYIDPYAGAAYAVRLGGGVKPEVVGSLAGLEGGVEWNGVFIGRVYGADGMQLWVANGAVPTLPRSWSLGPITVGHDRALVSLGQDEHGGAALIWKTREATPFAVSLPDHLSSSDCHLLSAFDGEVYVSCDMTKPTYEHDAPPPKQKLFALVKNERWEVLETPASFTSAASIASDGSVYFAEPRIATVTHCARNGAKCSMVPIESDAATDEMAVWRQYGTEVVQRNGNLNWQRVDVGRISAAKIGRVESVFARSENDIWALARTTSGTKAILHSGRIRERVRVMDPPGVVVAAHNERPPTSWAGHCDEVFVVLAEVAPGEPLDTTKIRRDEIDEVVTAAWTFAADFSWDVVKGRLHDRDVAGVVFLRSAPDAKLEVMEKKVQAVIDRYTKNPMSQPRATCTLPVLDRVL